MKKYALLLLITLAACITTPADLRQHGEKQEFTMKQPPASAAACVARNAENAGDVMWGHVSPNVREGVSPGTTELTIIGLLAADFVSSGSGSVATVYVNPHPLEFIRQRYLRAFHGC